MSDLIPWMEPWSGRVLVAGVFVIGMLIAARGASHVRCKSPACPRCGYNRSHSTSPICPECGRQSTSEAELFRRPRRWRVVMIGLLIAMALPVFVAQRRIRAYGWDYYTYVGPMAWIDPFKTQESVTVDGVMIRLERDRVPWSARERIVIHDAEGDEVETNDTGYRRWSLVPNANEPVSQLSRDARHVAVEEWSGGAHCCFTYRIYEIRDGRAWRIAVLALGNSQMAFVDVHGDGVDEITFVDDSFAYWNTCFACSPMPSVILRLADGELRPAFDLMCPVGDHHAKLGKFAEQIRDAWGNPAARSDNGVPVIVWSAMLDLIYAGSADDAFDLIAQTWPVDGPDRAEFEQSFLAELAGSQWAEDLAALNGGAFADRLLPFVRLTQQRSASVGD